MRSSLDFKALIALEPDLKKPTRLYTGDDLRQYAVMLQWPVRRVRRACHYKLFRRSTYLKLLAKHGKDVDTRARATTELAARAAIKPSHPKAGHISTKPSTTREPVNLSRYRFS
jgi:hypothetical protein